MASSSSAPPAVTEKDLVVLEQTLGESELRLATVKTELINHNTGQMLLTDKEFRDHETEFAQLTMDIETLYADIQRMTLALRIRRSSGDAA